MASAPAASMTRRSNPSAAPTPAGIRSPWAASSRWGTGSGPRLSAMRIWLAASIRAASTSRLVSSSQPLASSTPSTNSSNRRARPASASSIRAKAACEAGQASSIVGRPRPRRGCTTSASSSSNQRSHSAARCIASAGRSRCDAGPCTPARAAAAMRSSSVAVSGSTPACATKASRQVTRSRPDVPSVEPHSRSVRAATSSSELPGAYHSRSTNSTSCCRPRSPPRNDRAN